LGERRVGKELIKQMKERESSMSPGQKAVETKGPIELKRARKMAAWTELNGKNDAENPYSRQNIGSAPPDKMPRQKK
jgi:hypothetical protein